MRIYTYAKCSTCQRALKFLAASRLEPTVIPIREKPPTKAELERMLSLVGGSIRRLFNTSGDDYRKLNMKERLPKMDQGDLLELLSKNGNLVKRPFLLTDTWGTVGFDEAEWKRLLK